MSNADRFRITGRYSKVEQPAEVHKPMLVSKHSGFVYVG